MGSVATDSTIGLPEVGWKGWLPKVQGQGQGCCDSISCSDRTDDRTVEIPAAQPTNLVNQSNHFCQIKVPKGLNEEEGYENAEKNNLHQIQRGWRTG